MLVEKPTLKECVVTFSFFVIDVTMISVIMGADDGYDTRIVDAEVGSASWCSDW